MSEHLLLPQQPELISTDLSKTEVSTLPAPSGNVEDFYTEDSGDQDLQRLRGEAGVLGLEILGISVDYGALAINALRRKITERNLSRAETRQDKLGLSAKVHQESPKTFLAPTGDQGQRYSEVNPDYIPVTFLQRRQSLRAGRRQAKANIRSSREQYRLRRVYGDDIGTPGYEARIRSERMPAGQRRRALRAAGGWGWNAVGKYEWNESVINRNSDRVVKSSAGEDIPGRFINKRLTRNELRIENLNKRATNLVIAEQNRHLDIEERKQRRQDERLQRKERRAKVGRNVANGAKRATKAMGKGIVMGARKSVELGGKAGVKLGRVTHQGINQAGARVKNYAKITKNAYQEGKTGRVVSDGLIQRKIDNTARLSGRFYARSRAKL